MIVTCFMYSNYASNQKDRPIKTGVLIFINMYPIYWYNNQQQTVEAITFSLEFCAIKAAVDMAKALRNKLGIFVVPIDVPTNVYCDNEVVYKNTIIPESTIKKKHHSKSYNWFLEAVYSRTSSVAKQATKKK